jgi:hypothetical protein
VKPFLRFLEAIKMREKMTIMIQRNSLFDIKIIIEIFLVFLFLPPSIVVATLMNFVRMFIRAHDENVKQIEYEKKKADKEAAENEKSKLARNESGHMMRTSIKSGNIK